MCKGDIAEYFLYVFSIVNLLHFECLFRIKPTNMRYEQLNSASDSHNGIVHVIIITLQLFKLIIQNVCVSVSSMWTIYAQIFLENTNYPGSKSLPGGLLQTGRGKILSHTFFAQRKFLFTGLCQPDTEYYQQQKQTNVISYASWILMGRWV